MSNSYIECPTADSQKMSIFAKASRKFWTPDVYTQILYDMDVLKIPVIKEALFETKIGKEEFVNTTTPLKGLTILDVGCGGGYISEPLADLGCQVVGIDICFDMIEVAKQHASLNPALTNLTYLYESIEDHSKNNQEKYDAIIVSEVLVHINEQGLFLKETLSCLKPGGFIYISTCNNTWLYWFAGVILGEYVLRLFPRGIVSMDKHITPEDLKNKLQGLKCQTKGMLGMLYNPFSSRWFCSKYTCLYYSVYAIKDTI